VSDVKNFLQAFTKQKQISLRKDSQTKTTTSINAINTQNMKVLVASNSKNESELRVVASNMQLITSILSQEPALSLMEVYVIEVLFMLHAPLFLSYGAHASSDLVEFERMLQGREFCTRNELFVSTSSSAYKQVPWCQLYKNAQLVAAAQQVSNIYYIGGFYHHNTPYISIFLLIVYNVNTEGSH